MKNNPAKNYPKHIAIILDGNRRWAKERCLKPWEGHQEGANKWQDIKNWIINLDIKEMTLYVFSLQNFQRDKKEVYFLLKIFENTFKKIYNDPDIVKHQVRIRHIGNFSMLPESLQNIITKLDNKTKKYKNHVVNFALGYGGQEEIVEAVKKITEKVKKNIINISDIDTKLITDHLYLKNSPDIIIRTSGETRTSNFLVFQQAYSEWFFVEKYWPDFNKNDLQNIIISYQKRERRYGK